METNSWLTHNAMLRLNEQETAYLKEEVVGKVKLKSLLSLNTALLISCHYN